MIFKYKKISIILVLILILGIVTGCNNPQSSPPVIIGSIPENNVSSVGEIEINDIFDLEIKYIDVGQGDSALIKYKDKTFLIDGGDNNYGDFLVNFLKENSVKKIDYMVATHPHADHIGGLNYVFNAIETSVCYVSSPKESIIPTSKTYRDFLDNIETHNIEAIVPTAGEVVYEDNDFRFVILNDGESDANDLNNCSLVCKIFYKNNSFIFMGDTEEYSEKNLINQYDANFLKSDVIKLGHHGSRTSSRQDFLDIVNPQYTIISCGKDNKYGHPHKETIEKLKNMNIEYYITFEVGTISLASNGTNIRINTEKSH